MDLMEVVKPGTMRGTVKFVLRDLQIHSEFIDKAYSRNTPVILSKNPTQQQIHSLIESKHISEFTLKDKNYFLPSPLHKTLHPRLFFSVYPSSGALSPHRIPRQRIYTRAPCTLLSCKPPRKLARLFAPATLERHYRELAPTLFLSHSLVYMRPCRIDIPRT